MLTKTCKNHVRNRDTLPPHFTLTKNADSPFMGLPAQPTGGKRYNTGLTPC